MKREKNTCHWCDSDNTKAAGTGRRFCNECKRSYCADKSRYEKSMPKLSLRKHQASFKVNLSRLSARKRSELYDQLQSLGYLLPSGARLSPDAPFISLGHSPEGRGEEYIHITHRAQIFATYSGTTVTVAEFVGMVEDLRANVRTA